MFNGVYYYFKRKLMIMLFCFSVSQNSYFNMFTVHLTNIYGDMSVLIIICLPSQHASGSILEDFSMPCGLPMRKWQYDYYLWQFELILTINIPFILDFCYTILGLGIINIPATAKAVEFQYKWHSIERSHFFIAQIPKV